MLKQRSAALTTAPGERSLDRRVRTLWQLENITGAVAIVAGLAAAWLLAFPGVDWRPWVSAAGAVAVGLALVDGLITIPRRYRSYRYMLSGSLLVVRHGRLLVRTRTVPLSRILYVETREGPLLRHFQLCKLQIGTIAEPFHVGPLTPAEAFDLRRMVAQNLHGDVLGVKT